MSDREKQRLFQAQGLGLSDSASWDDIVEKVVGFHTGQGFVIDFYAWIMAVEAEYGEPLPLTMERPAPPPLPPFEEPKAA